MNKLSVEKQAVIIGALVEGASIRSVERMTGVHRDTIMRLMVRTGGNCEQIMDQMMRGLSCRLIQIDEIWAYVGKKQRQVTADDDKARVGDFWTWVALDADTKLVPTYAVGKRDIGTAKAFIADLSDRLANRVQISTDGLTHYITAIEEAFGGYVDYGMIVKSFEAEALGPGRYSPPKVVAAEKYLIQGRPQRKHISTSYVERQNLTMRMSMRRFTRLTNGFSKKPENLKAAVGLHFAHYNLCRSHKTLGMTPAMAAGIESRRWSVRDLIG